jgi:putative restriction endonuclease
LYWALRQGFLFQDQRVRLIGPQGIFKPAILPEMPLSIRTAARESNRPAPYDDSFSPDGSCLFYRYRGTNPSHYENVGLRLAMEQRRPLVYFHGVIKGEYLAAWPVYVVGDEPQALRFRVAIDDAEHVSEGLPDAPAQADLRRQYITVVTRQRLHQRSFRRRVLQAYQERCALCRLHHEQLLDAAHIVPDTDPRGEPVVANGLALCKLHHAAFDQHFLGIRPDCVIQVSRLILDEEDGPMLIHGLQGFHGQRLRLMPRNPDQRPRPDLLEQRYQAFLTAAAR